jgi:predicted DNA binding CopG/RHH family protein
MKKKLIVPKFKNEEDESKFWAKLDLSEYFEQSDFKKGKVFPSLKRSKRLISIRLPEQLLLQVKDEARKHAVPYQNLIQRYIEKGLQMK